MYSGVESRTGKSFGAKYSKEKYDVANNNKKSERHTDRPVFNTDLSEHERKRRIEVKCLEYSDALETQGFSSEEIELRIKSFREALLLEDKLKQEEEKQRQESAQDTHRRTENDALLRFNSGILTYIAADFKRRKQDAENQLKEKESAKSKQTEKKPKKDSKKKKTKSQKSSSCSSSSSDISPVELPSSKWDSYGERRKSKKNKRSRSPSRDRVSKKCA